MTNEVMVINAFVFYIGLMMAIGIYYYRQTKNISDTQFFFMSFFILSLKLFLHQIKIFLALTVPN